MTIEYLVNKCKYIAFIEKAEYIDQLAKPMKNVLTLDQFIDLCDNSDDKYKYFKHFTLLIDAEDKFFSDIKFELDGDEKGNSSKQFQDSSDLNKTIIVSGAKQLTAFNDEMFVINKTKRTAGIDELNKKQNHDVLDNIARNGVLCTPSLSSQLSVGVLFSKLSQYNSFDLVIVHSGLEDTIREGTAPSEYVMPIYTVGKGEITAVLYRYICIWFFSYIGVFNEEDREHAYDL